MQKEAALKYIQVIATNRSVERHFPPHRPDPSSQDLY
jgi:hypothetical protein